MNYEQFWEQDPALVVYYRKAEDYRNESKNQMMWLQGLYVYNAFASVISQGFGGSKGKNSKYLEKPIEGLFMKTAKEIAEEKENKRNIEKTVAALDNLLMKNKGGK